MCPFLLISSNQQGIFIFVNTESENCYTMHIAYIFVVMNSLFFMW
jgi:hypothetical protein